MRAYVYNRDGRFNVLQPLPEIQGAPDWIDDRYAITAKAEGGASDGMMNGPMLKALLEERFKLKIHRETKEVPVYELTVARGGLKAPRFIAGNCTPVDWNTPLPGRLQTQTQQHCIDRTTMRGAIAIIQADAISINAFIKFFVYRLDRPVIDKPVSRGYLTFTLNTHPTKPTRTVSRCPRSQPGQPSLPLYNTSSV